MMMTIKTALTVVSLAAATGIALAHHQVSSPFAADTNVEPTTREMFSQTIDDHSALTSAIITNARRQAAAAAAVEVERAERTVTVTAPTDEVISGGLFMVEQRPHLPSKVDGRFEKSPRPRMESSNRKSSKRRYGKPTAPRYNPRGKRRESHFRRSKFYDHHLKNRRERNRIGRLRGGISNISKPRRDYARRSMFRNSRWGRHADGRSHSRINKSNRALRGVRGRQSKSVRRRR